MAGSVRAKSASPGKGKPGSAARARREGSSYETCRNCNKSIPLSLSGWHKQECQGMSSEENVLLGSSLRSVADTQQQLMDKPVPDSTAQQQQRHVGPISRDQRVEQVGPVDWVEAFKLTGKEEIRDLTDSEDGRFGEDEPGRSCGEDDETQLEETQVLLGELGKNEGDSGDGGGTGLRKDYEEARDALARLREQLDVLRTEKEEVEGKLLGAQKANEELLAHNKVREANYDCWKLELEGRIAAKEEEAKGIQTNVECLTAANLELEDLLFAQKQETENAQENAEFQRTERQRVQEERDTLLSKLSQLQSLLEEQKLIIERVKICQMHQARCMGQLTALSEKCQSVLKVQSPLSSVVVNMVDPCQRERSKAAKEKLESIVSEPHPRSKLPEEVDNVIAAVKQVADRAVPCIDENTLVEHFFDGLKEHEVQKTSGLPTHAVKFLTTLPPEGLYTDSPASVMSQDTLPLAGNVEPQTQHVEGKLIVSRPMLDLEAEADSADTDFRADTVSSHLVSCHPDPSEPGQVVEKDREEHPPKGGTWTGNCWGPVTPARVNGGGVSEQQPTAGSPTVTVSPTLKVLTGPCAATVGCSIASLLAAFPAANGPGASESPHPPALNTPAQDVEPVTAKTSLAGPSSKRALNLEAASEKGSNLRPHVEAGASADQSVDLPKMEETEVSKTKEDGLPASSRDIDKAHETPNDSDAEEPVIVRSAKKGKGSEGRPVRRSRVVSSSDSDSGLGPSPLRRRLFPLSEVPSSPGLHQVTPPVDQEAGKSEFGIVDDDDVQEVSGSSWQRRSTRRRMSFHSTGEKNHVHRDHDASKKGLIEGNTTAGPGASLHDENLCPESSRGINMTPGKRKEHLALEDDTSGASSPFKRVKHLKRRVGGRKQPSLRRSSRLQRNEELGSDSIHEDESEEDDLPIRITRRSAKENKFVDLRTESDDEEEIEDSSYSGDGSFINDEPASDNSYTVCSDASAGGDSSEAPTMDGGTSLKWDLKGDMTAAFGKDDLLCMRAVCSLFRHQTADERAQRNSSLQNGVGFDKFRARRGSELALFLIDDDRDMRLSKSVEELKEKWPNGVEECRDLALHHADQLFRIYKANEDHFPLG